MNYIVTTFEQLVKLNSKFADYYNELLLDDFFDNPRENYSIESYLGYINSQTYDFRSEDDIRNRVHNSNNSGLIYINDWLKQRNVKGDDGYKSDLHPDNPKLNIRRMSINQLLSLSENWRNTLSIVDEPGYTEITYPNGMYWRNLETHQCDTLKKTMRNCGGESGTTLHQLRRVSEGVIIDYITVSISNLEKPVTYTQCKGKENSHPKEEYYLKILDLFELLDVKQFSGTYKPHLDFKFSDLKDYDIDLYEKWNKGVLQATALIEEMLTNDISFREFKKNVILKKNGTDYDGTYHSTVDLMFNPITPEGLVLDLPHYDDITTPSHTYTDMQDVARIDFVLFEHIEKSQIISEWLDHSYNQSLRDEFFKLRDDFDKKLDDLKLPPDYLNELYFPTDGTFDLVRL